MRNQNPSNLVFYYDRYLNWIWNRGSLGGVWMWMYVWMYVWSLLATPQKGVLVLESWWSMLTESGAFVQTKCTRPSLNMIPRTHKQWVYTWPTTLLPPAVVFLTFVSTLEQSCYVFTTNCVYPASCASWALMMDSKLLFWRKSQQAA